MAEEYAKEYGKQLQVLGSTYNPISKNSFESFYLKYREQLNDDNRLTQLILTGHHGNYTFSGTNGELSLNDIKEILGKFNETWDDLDKIILRGCYTVTAETILPDSPWLSLAPNVSLIAGFEKKAWDDATPMSSEFFKSVLRLDTDKWIEKNTRQLWQSFEDIPYQSKSALGLWVKSSFAPVGGVFMSTENGFRGRYIIDNESAIRQCNLKYSAKNEHAKAFDAYAKGILPIPKNSSRSRLRKAYEFVNVNNHCYRLSRDWITDRVNKNSIFDSESNLEQIMPILFYHNILENTDRYLTHKFGEAWFVDWVEYISSDPVIKIDKRYKLLKDLRELTYDIVLTTKGDVGSITTNHTAPSERLSSISYLLNNVVYNFDHFVLPDRWMTDKSSIAEPNNFEIQTIIF